MRRARLNKRRSLRRVRRLSSSDSTSNVEDENTPVVWKAPTQKKSRSFSTVKFGYRTMLETERLTRSEDVIVGNYCDTTKFYGPSTAWTSVSPFISVAKVSSPVRRVVSVRISGGRC